MLFFHSRLLSRCFVNIRVVDFRGIVLLFLRCLPISTRLLFLSGLPWTISLSILSKGVIWPNRVNTLAYTNLPTVNFPKNWWVCSSESPRYSKHSLPKSHLECIDSLHICCSNAPFYSWPKNSATSLSSSSSSSLLPCYLLPVNLRSLLEIGHPQKQPLFSIFSCLDQISLSLSLSNRLFRMLGFFILLFLLALFGRHSSILYLNLSICTIMSLIWVLCIIFPFLIISWIIIPSIDPFLFLRVTLNLFTEGLVRVLFRTGMTHWSNVPSFKRIRILFLTKRLQLLKFISNCT